MKIIGVEREEGQIKSIQVETAEGVIKFVPSSGVQHEDDYKKDRLCE